MIERPAPPRTIVQIGDTAGVPQRLATGLRRRGLDVVEATPPAPLASAGSLLKLVSLPTRLRWGRSLIHAVSSFDDPVLHVHYATSAIPLLGSGMPLVVHAHGSDVRAPGRLQHTALRAVWRESALRLVATPDLLDEVPDGIYLPNPIDVDGFRIARELPPDRDVLVFAALTPVKGADVLVAAVRELKAQRPDCTVTALEGGPFEQAMRDAGAQMTARRSAADLPALVARHRIVLGQQLLGALGVADLEAMASARPVVMRLRTDLDYGEQPPIVNESAPEMIAGAALELLDDAALRLQLGSASLSWVERHHGTDRIVTRLTGLYDEFLPARQRRARRPRVFALRR